MATSNDMSLTHQIEETDLAKDVATSRGIDSLNQLKLRLSQLEMYLSRLAVVFGLSYGCLQDLAPCFLKVKSLLLKLARQHDQDSDLIDLAESLLTDASGRDLCELEEQLLTIRRYAQDPGKQHLAPAYRLMMNDLLILEKELQVALQKALGNLAG